MIKRFALASLYPEKNFLLSRFIQFTADKFKFADNEIADFSDTLFVFPTAEAGRLFREKAALFFKDRGGVMQIQTLLPEQLLFNRSDINCTLPVQLECWFDILNNTSAKSTQLLKQDVAYTPEALLSIAEICIAVRENIRLESCMNTQNFINSIDNDILKEKISDFEKLEKIYLEKIYPLKDKAAAIEQNLTDPLKNLQNIKNIILVECTELKNSIVTLLENISEVINVDICMNINETDWNKYDKAGRPLPDSMLCEDLPFCPEESFRMYSTPLQEAIKISSLLDKNNLPESIGVLDNDLAAPLTHLLTEKNIEVYTPREKQLSSFYWYNLFNELLELRKKSIPFEKVYEWAADESFAAYAGFDSVEVCTDIEKLQRNHLIQDFSALKFFCNQNNSDTGANACMVFCHALENLQDELQKIKNDFLPEGIWNIFAKIAQCNSLQNMDANYAEISLEALKKIIVSIRKMSSADSKTAIFKYLINKTMIKDTVTFKDDAVKFSGFLDLIWYENKSLIISGFTEKSFNQASSEDIFFPDHIRQKLNWSSAASRFAADIHRFSMLCKQYNCENIFMTYSNTDLSGRLNSLPRLLFTVNDQRFIKHCDLFFNSKLTEKPYSADNSGDFKLKYAPSFKGTVPEKISVTAFKKYISCPYSFYLSVFLKCQEQGQELFELQPYQSGDIIHSILEEYGKSFRSEIPTEDCLNDFIALAFEKKFRSLTGFSINNIALMQSAEIKKSLQSFVEYELDYRNRFSKHQILHTELKINVTFNDLWSRLPKDWTDSLPPLSDEIKDIVIVGKIDRIDLAELSDGRQFCHIIDYKTAKTPETPKSAHLSKKLSSHLDKNMMAADSLKNYFFCDMQLIIYQIMAQFMRDLLGIPQDIEIRCGYFNLPEDTGKTSISFFNDLDDHMLEKGALSLRYLMTKIFTEKSFWPPSLQSKYSIADNYFSNCSEDDFTKEDSSYEQ